MTLIFVGIIIIIIVDIFANFDPTLSNLCGWELLHNFQPQILTQTEDRDEGWDYGNGRHSAEQAFFKIKGQPDRGQITNNSKTQNINFNSYFFNLLNNANIWVVILQRFRLIAK